MTLTIKKIIEQEIKFPYYTQDGIISYKVISEKEVVILEFGENNSGVHFYKDHEAEVQEAILFDPISKEAFNKVLQDIQLSNRAHLIL